MLHRFHLTIALVFGLLLAACGSGPDATDTAVADPDGGEGAVENSDDEPAESVSTSTSSTTVVEVEETPDVGAALAGLTELQSYRIEIFSGQRLISNALGVNSVAELDLEHPSTVTEVTPDGTHSRVDLTAALGGLIDPSLDPIALEMWVGDEQIIVDTTSYQTLVDLDPSGDLGPFRPGVAFIDLAVAAEIEPEILVGSIGGSSVDLQTLGRQLPSVVNDLVKVESDPIVLVGDAIYTDVLEAMGTDARQMAYGAAGGVALTIDLDPEVLGAFYLDFYRSLVIDVAITLRSDGSVESIYYEADLSDLWGRIFADTTLITGVSEAERAEAIVAFADTIWTLESLTRFEPISSLTIPHPPADAEDRTEEYVNFLVNSGVLEADS
ncbi:MAG: hypothetical protein GY773_13535 [Actinomycetia bacterium]|nr:hypothetical protein [Actinomycetes bacterium]